MRKRASRPTQSRAPRNPSWTRDELILALDTYFSLVQACKVPAPHLSEIENLQKILERYASSYWLNRQILRTKDSIVMKMMNFRHLDPAYPGAGLGSLGKKDWEVWKEFARDRKNLRLTADALRENICKAKQPESEEEISEASEGGLLSRQHFVRERNAALIRRKKQEALAYSGHLVCEVCSFNFETMYGQRGSGFIEVHHIKPVRTLKPGSKTRLDDLALLCANCHRMIHAKIPWLKVEELRKTIKKPSTDIFTVSKRSEIMSKVRSSGNRSTEIKLAEIFRKNKITGWRRHVSLPGKPDFFFPKEKVCVFADGCFWHKCPKCFVPPKSNSRSWHKKIEENAKRDQRVRKKLRRMGFSVLTVWECDIKKRPEVVVKKILRAL